MLKLRLTVALFMRHLILQGKADFYRFGGNNLDFLLTLTPYNTGDADLYCGPAVAGFSANPMDNVWSSGGPSSTYPLHVSCVLLCIMHYSIFRPRRFVQ